MASTKAKRAPRGLRRTVRAAAGSAAKAGVKAETKGEAQAAVKAEVVAELVSNDGLARFFVGDCRRVLPALPEVARSEVDLVFADPPFNWNRDYDRWKAGAGKGGPDYDTWHDGMPREDYLAFTRGWLGLCAGALRPGGALWVNIPDDTAAEIVVHCKSELGLTMASWCIWHYRFGQNRTGGFISSKVHALYFVKPGGGATWDGRAVLEPSDRASTYFDPRTQSKRDGMPPGMRVPLDVWYGANWGRVQGNNKERRPGHDNQLPEAYLERVILATSREGDLVLDPFIGSGTTAVVAAAYGRRFIGSEFSAANARSAMQRVNSGMVNKGKALGQPTAIFAPRRSAGRPKGPRGGGGGGVNRGG